jgi:hypothetical protein
VVHKDTVLVSLVLIVGTRLHVPTSELLLIAPSLALLACVPTSGNEIKEKIKYRIIMPVAELVTRAQAQEH